MKLKTSRRDFIKNSTLAGVGFWVSSSRLAAQESKSPNEKLEIGIIGAGGKGYSDMQAVASHNIVALCDVDERQAALAIKDQPKAKFYKDYRELLEKERSLDAVIVATPDHNHAPASVMAMKLGKHVYCQKPLTHTIYEARVMRELAVKLKGKVATQMGNQGSAEPGLRRAVEIIQAGVIGPVREVHVWSNRPIWPQGADAILQHQGVKFALHGPQSGDGLRAQVPSEVAWDNWLGPAPWRSYDPIYAPFKWRGWLDYGTGALGDMACHTANMPFRALKLEHPVSIEAESAEMNSETYPRWSRIVFEFPARGDMPPVKFFWYDGGKKPPKEVTEGMNLASVKGGKKRKRVEELKPGDIPGSGCLLVGDQGTLFSPDDYGSAYKLFPDEDYADYKGPPESIPRSPGHYVEWINCAKGGPQAYSSFEFAGLLTETILLGNAALRAGKKLDWDGPNLKFTNVPEANNLLHYEYRKGWTL